jgi:hypothetical protein
LITIHGERLSDLGENKHVVCVDMKAANGAIHDRFFHYSVLGHVKRHRSFRSQG